MTVGIPKIMSHIWIGPKPMPEEWMQTWKDQHPDWDYCLYDHDFLRAYPFRTRKLINEYYWRGEYAGVQDLMRYEILFEFGGFMADADAICKHPIDELVEDASIYTVYDRAVEEGRGVSPFLASNPGHPLLAKVIDTLCELEPWELRKPFHSTGNLFLMKLINAEKDPNLVIWPSHYFIPWHHSDPDNVYTGPDTIYAEQKWGSATYAYNSKEVAGDRAITREEVALRAATLRRDLLSIVQPRIKDPIQEQKKPHPARKAADKSPDAWNDALADTKWESRLAEMNEAALTSLEKAGEDAVINGHGFYRPKQKHRLTESKFMTAPQRLRERVSSYLANAKSVFQIGVDAGHMLLLQKTLTPDAQITAFDACQPVFPGSAATNVYTPSTMEWFKNEFPDEVTFLSGRPIQTIGAHCKKNPDWRVDVLHFNGIDVNFLKCYGQAINALSDDGIILVQDINADAVREHLEELQLICEVAQPFEFANFGNRAGGLFVAQRRSATDRNQ